jgi:hypothetical protein
LPGLAIAATLATSQAFADAVTDWNLYTSLATKGATSKTTGSASAALNSNVATRVAAIEARAVFDAVNVIERFSNTKAITTPAAHQARLHFNLHLPLPLKRRMMCSMPYNRMLTPEHGWIAN